MSVDVIMRVPPIGKWSGGLYQRASLRRTFRHCEERSPQAKFSREEKGNTRQKKELRRLKGAGIPLPLFFVSVAFKRVSVFVSHLESTLTEAFASVDSKRFMQKAEIGFGVVRGEMPAELPVAVWRSCGRRGSDWKKRTRWDPKYTANCTAFLDNLSSYLSFSNDSNDGRP